MGVVLTAAISASDLYVGDVSNHIFCCFQISVWELDKLGTQNRCFYLSVKIRQAWHKNVKVFHFEDSDSRYFADKSILDTSNFKVS